MLGYWNNDKANAETLKDGWLRTGDVGRLDEDGFLTLSDRSKDVIISGGTNIYPREVEEALLTHPAVREVSAIGGARAGLGPRSWSPVVVLGPARRPTMLRSTRSCLANIARFKRPKRYVYRGCAAEEQLRQGAEDRAAGDDARFGVSGGRLVVTTLTRTGIPRIRPRVWRPCARRTPPAKTKAIAARISA